MFSICLPDVWCMFNMLSAGTCFIVNLVKHDVLLGFRVSCFLRQKYGSLMVSGPPMYIPIMILVMHLDHWIHACWWRVHESIRIHTPEKAFWHSQAHKAPEAGRIAYLIGKTACFGSLNSCMLMEGARKYANSHTRESVLAFTSTQSTRSWQDRRSHR